MVLKGIFSSDACDWKKASELEKFWYIYFSHSALDKIMGAFKRWSNNRILEGTFSSDTCRHSHDQRQNYKLTNRSSVVLKSMTRKGPTWEKHTSFILWPQRNILPTSSPWIQRDHCRKIRRKRECVRVAVWITAQDITRTRSRRFGRRGGDRNEEKRRETIAVSSADRGGALVHEIHALLSRHEIKKKKRKMRIRVIYQVPRSDSNKVGRRQKEEEKKGWNRTNK